MNRDEIYDHLAKVYLGKKNSVQETKKKKLNAAWLMLNIISTLLILVSSFYGFTAFLNRQQVDLKNRVVYSLNNNPIRIAYNLDYPFPPVKTFSLPIPSRDLSKFSKLNLSVRGMEEGFPGVVKLVLSNQRNEKATYFIEDVGLSWQHLTIPLDKFKMADLTSVTDVAFVLESWNVENKTGIVLIDDISFSN
jgi:hypothetical protein